MNNPTFRILSETKQTLDKWTTLLKRIDHFELGDDVRLVTDMQHDLRDTVRKISTLRPYFKLSVVPLAKANAYFNTTRYLEQALLLLDTIIERDYGSYQHTRQCLATLNQCTESLTQMSRVLVLHERSVPQPI